MRCGTTAPRPGRGGITPEASLRYSAVRCGDTAPRPGRGGITPEASLRYSAVRSGDTAPRPGRGGITPEASLRYSAESSFLKVAGAKSHGTKKRPIRHNKKIFTAFSLTPREIPNNVFFSKHPTGSSLRFATFSENGSCFECRIVHNFQRSLTITSNYLDVSRGSRVPPKQVFHTFLDIVRKLKSMRKCENSKNRTKRRIRVK